MSLTQAAYDRQRRGLTDMIMRRWKGCGPCSGDVFVLILDHDQHASGCDCAVYQHVGQHSEANLRHCLESSVAMVKGVAQGATPVCPADSTDGAKLDAELRRIGYLPFYLNRAPAWRPR